MRQIKVVVEKHADGYVAYPLGIKGVVVGQGDSYEDVSLTFAPPSRFTPRRSARIRSMWTSRSWKPSWRKPASTSDPMGKFPAYAPQARSGEPSRSSGSSSSGNVSTSRCVAPTLMAARRH